MYHCPRARRPRHDAPSSSARRDAIHVAAWSSNRERRACGFIRLPHCRPAEKPGTQEGRTGRTAPGRGRGSPMRPALSSTWIESGGPAASPLAVDGDGW
jgi:hypothetical protein